MQTNKILSAPLIDLVFEGRNKEYGAYELRNSYAKRINKALFITTAIAALVFGGAVLANSFKKKEEVVKISQDISLVEIAEEKPIEELPPPEKPIEQPPQTQTVKFTDMKIVEDNEVETPPPSQDDFVDSKIGEADIEGIKDDGTAKVEDIDKGQKIIEEKIEKEPEIYTTVEIDAKYTGNWRAFLEKNLNGNVPTDNNAPPGTYTILIQFVVDKEGNVSDLKPLTNHGYGMEQECVRVLKKATKWEPAIQNGYAVKAYRRQPITFQVLEE